MGVSVIVNQERRPQGKIIFLLASVYEALLFQFSPRAAGTGRAMMAILRYKEAARRRNLSPTVVDH